MLKKLAGVVFTTVLSGALPAQTEFAARLAGHAILPAETFLEMPADAPADLRISGKFTNNLVRNETVGSFEGSSAGRPTGVRLPFRGQPVQGHSGVKKMEDGSFWVLSDNGFGTKANSPDAALFLSHYTINWDSGRIDRVRTVFLHDPDKRVPFRIVHEGTEKRYLTGGDFDPEGFQILGGKFWIGEEFGPFLIRADRDGRVEAVFETLADGKPVMSPDHYRIVAPIPGQTAPAAVNLGRSRGFEGLAASKDGRFLYGMLEGPLWDSSTKDWEKLDGQLVLRVLEFSVAEERWTGRHWKYPLTPGATAIGDFNMIDATTALVIERDDGEGTADRACPDARPAPNCFHDLARFKRVVKIEMNDANANASVRKIGFVDLMRIQDPNRADDNEFLLLEVEALLKAR